MTLTHDDHAPGPELGEVPPSSTAAPVPAPPPRRGSRRRSARRRELQAGRRLVPGRGMHGAGPIRWRPAAWRTGGARPAGRRGPGHRARRPLKPTLRWRVLVATLGAFLLTICSGMALGVVTWSPDGLGLRFRSEPQSPPLVNGLDGVFPGGPAHNVPLTVQNTEPSAFEISTVAADLTALPADCPATAWQVLVPELLPTVPARSEVTVPLPVVLTADAPATCQGVTVNFPVRIDGLRHPLPQSEVTSSPTADGAGGAVPRDEPAADATDLLTPHSLTATATVTAARLGSPSGTTSVHGAKVEVTPVRPVGGPPPARYDIDVLGAGDRRTSVCTGTTVPCVDPEVPAASARRYVVTARIGSAWQQQSRPVTAWTPPPAPSLAFADGSGTGAAQLVVTASGAASDYDIELVADGTPFHHTRVSAGGGLSRTVDAPGFGSGHHRLVAVSRFHGWRAYSSTLTVTVSSDGVAEPGPSEEPVPVSSDSPSDSEAPPTASVPSTSAPELPTRTTAPPSIVVKPRPVARPNAGPPVAVVEETTTPPVEAPPAGELPTAELPPQGGDQPQPVDVGPPGTA